VRDRSLSIFAQPSNPHPACFSTEHRLESNGPYAFSFTLTHDNTGATVQPTLVSGLALVD
jgi:hypothetical protein